MSDKRNIRDHKRRLLAAKYELIRKLRSFFKTGKTSFVLVPVAKKEFLCTNLRPMLCIDTGRPRGVVEFFRIYHIVFRGLASRGRSGIKKSSFLVGHQTNRKPVSSAAGPQARVVGLLPSGSGPKRRSHPYSPIVDANGMGIEGGVPPQNIDYVQGKITA